MGLVSPTSLLLGAVLSAPALWHGFVTGRLDVTTALIRFVLAVLVAGGLLAILRFMTSGYGRGAAAATPSRRATDKADDPVDTPTA